jgi:hypothetical protein
MAYIPGSYFSNALVGSPQFGADVNVLEVNATPKFAVGTGFTRQDGNVYRYGYCSGGLAAGMPGAPTFATSGFTVLANAIIAPASAVAVAGDIVKPGAIGSRYIEFTKASVTVKDVYKGGYCIINDGSGQGFTYRIKGSTITDDPASGNMRIELYEKLAYAVVATTDFIVVPNLYSDIVIADVTNAAVCGIAAGTTTSALPWGWWCVRGQIGAYQDGAWAIGSPLVRGSVGLIAMGAGLTNTVQLGTTGGQIVGYAVANGADNKTGVAYLTLA